MNHVTALLASLSLITLSACATIIEGSDDQIAVSTNPASNATCTLTNQRATYHASASSAASVKKSRSDMRVVCADPYSGARGESVVVSEVEPWAFGNILLGGIIGLGVDWSTGAAYDYPASTTVPLYAGGAASQQPVSYPNAQPSTSATPYYTQPGVTPLYPQAAPAAPAVQYYAPAAPQSQPQPQLQQRPAAAPFSYGTSVPAAPRY
jgi:hypothetical protein